MNPLWLLLIVPGSIVGGAIGLLAAAWFTRDIFPTIFMPSDW